MDYCDYLKAYITIPENASEPLQLAARVLKEELYHRTGLTLAEEGKGAVIRLCVDGTLKKRDEFSLRICGTSCTVSGHDGRAVLYGVGKLLRICEWREGYFALPDGYALTTAPEKPIRGVQFGYHATSNACDAWSPEIYDQYIRELALFGASCIEILPPRCDDKNPLLVYDEWEMLRFVSETAHKYGMEVWMWYANRFDDNADEQTLAKEIAERRRVFAEIPYLNHVFIPGGDPGSLSPPRLFSWAKTVSRIAAEYHPHTGLWLSPQTGTPSALWRDSFYAEVDKRPSWLTGVVFGPWERDNVPTLRKRIPAEYPIRGYPDIAHSLRCQYPVPEWNLTMALTLGREFVNPRPRDEKHIHNIYKEYNDGSLSYSEGINDDFNKFLWLTQDWDSNTPCEETTREYAGLFIDCALKEELTKGFFLLEENLQGEIEKNVSIEKTYALWTSLKDKLCPYAKNNYRFEMHLLRALYDYYQKERRIFEAVLEDEAMTALRSADIQTVDNRISDAVRILNKANTQRKNGALAGRINALSDLLFEHIGAQLTQTRHFACNWDRGAFVECLNIPLNDRRYILKCLETVKNAASAEEKLAAVDALTNRTNPGEGGFYTDCGTPESASRFENYGNRENDPGFYQTPLTSYLMPSPFEERDTDRVPGAWRQNVSILYQMPLVMNYDGLDPDSAYVIRTVYAKYHTVHITLRAGEDAGVLIHDEVTVDVPFLEDEHILPKAAYADGTLRLSFTVRDGERGPNVSEILIKKV